MLPESWYISKAEKARIKRLEKENRKKEFCDDIELRIKKAKTLKEIERIRKICELDSIRKRKRNLLRKLREIAKGRDISLEEKRELPLENEIEEFIKKYERYTGLIENFYYRIKDIQKQLESQNVMNARISLNEFIKNAKEIGIQYLNDENLIKRIKEIIESPVKDLEEKINEIKEIKKYVNEEKMIDPDTTWYASDYVPTETEIEEEGEPAPSEPLTEFEAMQIQQEKEDEKKIKLETEQTEEAKELQKIAEQGQVEVLPQQQHMTPSVEQAPVIPTVEEPTVEEPIVEEPTVEEPTVEEPIVEEPTVEEPTVEQPPVTPIQVEPTIMPTAEIEAKQEQQKKEDQKKIIYEGELSGEEEEPAKIKGKKTVKLVEPQKKKSEKSVKKLREEKEKEKESLELEIIKELGTSEENIYKIEEINKAENSIIDSLESYTYRGPKIKNYNLVRSVLTMIIENLNNPKKIKEKIEEPSSDPGNKEYVRKVYNYYLLLRRLGLTDRQINLMMRNFLNELDLRMI
jgi:hypothetical protein